MTEIYSSSEFKTYVAKDLRVEYRNSITYSYYRIFFRNAKAVTLADAEWICHVDFSERYFQEQFVNYIELNGKKYRYDDIHSNFERFKLLIDHENEIQMVEDNLS